MLLEMLFIDRLLYFINREVLFIDRLLYVIRDTIYRQVIKCY